MQAEIQISPIVEKVIPIITIIRFERKHCCHAYTGTNLPQLSNSLINL